jgi:hypothetical protein
MDDTWPLDPDHWAPIPFKPSRSKPIHQPGCKAKEKVYTVEFEGASRKLVESKKEAKRLKREYQTTKYSLPEGDISIVNLDKPSEEDSEDDFYGADANFNIPQSSGSQSVVARINRTSGDENSDDDTNEPNANFNIPQISGSQQAIVSLYKSSEEASRDGTDGIDATLVAKPIDIDKPNEEASRDGTHTTLCPTSVSQPGVVNVSKPCEDESHDGVHAPDVLLRQTSVPQPRTPPTLGWTSRPHTPETCVSLGEDDEDRVLDLNVSLDETRPKPITSMEVDAPFRFASPVVRSNPDQKGTAMSMEVDAPVRLVSPVLRSTSPPRRRPTPHRRSRCPTWSRRTAEQRLRSRSPSRNNQHYGSPPPHDHHGARVYTDTYIPHYSSGLGVRPFRSYSPSRGPPSSSSIIHSRISFRPSDPHRIPRSVTPSSVSSLPYSSLASEGALDHPTKHAALERPLLLSRLGVAPSGIHARRLEAIAFLADCFRTGTGPFTSAPLAISDNVLPDAPVTIKAKLVIPPVTELRIRYW